MDTKKKLEDKINQRIGDDYLSTVTAQKWGNSLGIRIPKEAADRIGIGQGSEMELRVVGGESITLKPKRTPKKYTLEELLEIGRASCREGEDLEGRRGMKRDKRT